MSRPSEPLLRWLRAQIDQRKENTASLAGKIGMDRGELRRVLQGNEPLLVDHLLLITEALGLTAADMGLPASVPEEEAAEAIEALPQSAHWDNQPRAALDLAVRYGIDMMIFASADELEGWGGPEPVRAQYKGKEIPLQVDAAFHKYMNIRLEDDAAHLTLSFDALYTCRFPWATIKRVMLQPLPPAPVEKAPEPAPDAPRRGGHLRLVR